MCTFHSLVQRERTGFPLFPCSVQSIPLCPNPGPGLSVFLPPPPPLTFSLPTPSAKQDSTRLPECYIKTPASWFYAPAPCFTVRGAQASPRASGRSPARAEGTLGSRKTHLVAPQKFVFTNPLGRRSPPPSDSPLCPFLNFFMGEKVQP